MGRGKENTMNSREFARALGNSQTLTGIPRPSGSHSLFPEIVSFFLNLTVHHDNLISLLVCEVSW